MLFLSLLEEVALHISNFLYDLLVLLVFPWKELPVLEVVQHDGNKSHLIIWLEHKKKKKCNKWLPFQKENNNLVFYNCALHNST